MRGSEHQKNGRIRPHLVLTQHGQGGILDCAGSREGPGQKCHLWDLVDKRWLLLGCGAASKTHHETNFAMKKSAVTFGGT